jgi:hypothetical protein
MRTPTLLFAAVAAALVAAGCAPGRNDDLKEVVDGVAPVEGDMLECSWATNWGTDSGSYYDCFYLVRGKPRVVAGLVLERLRNEGFIVSCRANKTTVEMIGTRGGTLFLADVLGRGFVHGRNVSASDVDIPRGHVLVELAAAEGEADDVGPPPGYLCADA